MERMAMSDGVTESALPEIVFVVGAGASAELGFPVGSGLKQQIGKLLASAKLPSLSSWDNDLFTCAARNYGNVEGIEHKGLVSTSLHIGGVLALAESIDNFVDSRRSEKLLVDLSKLAIVRIILGYESACRGIKSEPSDLSLDHIDKSWLIPFFRLLTENCEWHELEARLKTVGIVTFNYDRCIEQYLSTMFCRYYAKPLPEALELISHLRIIHAYGDLGPIKADGAAQHLDFGDNRDDVHLAYLLVEAAKRIKTFTESVDEESEQTKLARMMMKGASKTVFLGFGYAEPNLRYLYGGNLQPLDEPSPYSEVATAFGSALGISAFDRAALQEKIQYKVRKLRGTNAEVILASATAAELFGMFSTAIRINKA
jgi:hypothetical protein